jgi:hypothetical protein
MHALPIFGITGRSLWFVVANLFSLFRLSWLPLAMLIATTYGMAYGIAQVSPGEAEKAVLNGGAFLFATFTELVLNGIVLSVIAVNVHRIILFDDRRPDIYFAFPFGRTELLYVLMGVLTYVFLALLIGVISFIYFTLAGMVPRGAALVIAAMVEAASEAAPKANPWVVALTVITFIVGYILAVWLMLRLTVWPPAVVANNRLSLGEALRLSKGRVFALLGLMIASSLAYITVFFIFVVAVAVAASAGGGMESWISVFEANSLMSKVILMLSGKTVNPNAILFEFFYILTATAYTVAILSFAYKALKGFDVDNAIDPLSAENDPSLHMPMGAH